MSAASSSASEGAAGSDGHSTATAGTDAAGSSTDSEKPRNTPEAVGVPKPAPNESAIRSLIEAQRSRRPARQPVGAAAIEADKGLRADPTAPAFGATKALDLNPSCTTGTLTSNHPTATFDGTGQYAVRGEPLIWTATSDCVAAEYRFVFRDTQGAWSEQQAWSTTNTFSWNTTNLPLGFYDQQVWIRSGSTGSYQIYKGTGVLLNDAAQCSALTVVPDIHYAVKGETVHFTATPTCAGQPRIAFYVLGPNDTSYRTVQDWSVQNTYNLNTTGLTSGYWNLIAWVTDVPFDDSAG
ncbi:MAG: hypothetical protein ABIQ16_06400, partial [Polyangiaceae bacterium]